MGIFHCVEGADTLIDEMDEQMPVSSSPRAAEENVLKVAVAQSRVCVLGFLAIANGFTAAAFFTANSAAIACESMREKVMTGFQNGVCSQHAPTWMPVKCEFATGYCVRFQALSASSASDFCSTHCHNAHAPTGATRCTNNVCCLECTPEGPVENCLLMLTFACWLAIAVFLCVRIYKLSVAATSVAEGEASHESPPARNRTPCPIIGTSVPLRVLPASLAGSTAASALWMVTVQLPALRRLLGDIGSVTEPLVAIFVVLNAVTLVCMAYCMLCDPGQVPKGCTAIPDRAHKAWICERPIRRYDHYCRWLMNAVGLLNHREFFVMLAGLVASVALGVIVDVVAIVVEGALRVWHLAFPSALHLAYCSIFLHYAGGMLRQHFEFITRNELNHENKQDLFWRVDKASMLDGHRVDSLDDEEHSPLEGQLVRDLSVHTFNALDLTTTRYDPLLNQYDQGWRLNWVNFWFTPRWTPEQAGDF